MANPKQMEAPADLNAVDITPAAVERAARGFILGSTAIGKRKEVRELLEERVINRIGKKGKYLTDKLFELIEGVYVVDKRAGNQIRYYQVPPNLNAIIYALDRVLGKPVAKTESKQEKKGILLVEHIIKNMAADPYGKRSGGNNESAGRGDTAVTGAGHSGGAGISVDAGARQ